MDRVRGDIRREVERHLSPEFRNRIDDIVLFTPLTPSDVRRIAADYLHELEQTLDKAGKTIEIDDAALDLVAIEGYSLAFGARFLKRVIDERIKVPLTLRWKDAAHFRVRLDGGSVVVDTLTPCAAASFRPAAYLDVA
jgi:ATP-dependent Clp protease ATP-binding subunit ClpA